MADQLVQCVLACPYSLCLFQIGPDHRLVVTARSIGPSSLPFQSAESADALRSRSDRCEPASGASSLSVMPRLLRRADLLTEYPWLTSNSFRHLKKLTNPPAFFRLGREEVIFEDDWIDWLRSRAG